MVRILRTIFIAFTSLALVNAAVAPVERDSDDYIQVTADLGAVVSAVRSLDSAVLSINHTSVAISTVAGIVSTINSACAQVVRDTQAVSSFTAVQATTIISTVSGVIPLLHATVTALTSDVVSISAVAGGHGAVCTSLQSLTLSFASVIGGIARKSPQPQQGQLLAFVAGNATVTIDVATCSRAYGC